MLSNLENKTTSLGALCELDIKGVQDWWEVIRVKVNIDDGTDDSLDGTGLEVGRGGVGAGRGDY